MTNPTTPAPAGGGMPKWLIVLIVILLVIVLGCCGGIATCVFLFKKGVQKAGENMPAFQQKIMDAAREQAKANGVELNTPDATGNAPMPSNFPSDIPAYTGAKTVSSMASIKDNSGQAIMQTSDSAATVKDFYAKQMTDQGWKEESNTSEGADSFSLVYSKDNRTANISINHGGKETTVMVIYGKEANVTFRWFDGHLDLAYLAQHGRDMTLSADSSGGGLLPAAVTFPELKKGNVRAAFATIFIQPRVDEAAAKAKNEEPLTGPWTYATPDEAYHAAISQIGIYQQWNRSNHVEILTGARIVGAAANA